MTRFVYVLPAGRFRWEVRVSAYVHPQRSTPPTDLLSEIEERRTDEAFMERIRNRVAEDADLLQRIGEDELLIADLRARLSQAEVDVAPVSLFYRLKRDALIAARAIAIIIGGEVQPHDRRGRIQDPDSYGNDPERSVG